MTKSDVEDPSVILTQAQLVAIADAVSIGLPHPAKFPAKFAYLPPGLTLAGTRGDLASWPGYQSASAGLDLTNPAASSGALSIDIAPASIVVIHPAPPNAAAPVQLAINGFTGSYIPGDTIVVMTNSTTHVTLVGADLSVAEITKIIQSTTVASDPLSVTTWYDAADVLP
jgi:hypothetical protein